MWEGLCGGEVPQHLFPQFTQIADSLRGGKHCRVRKNNGRTQKPPTSDLSVCEQVGVPLKCRRGSGRPLSDQKATPMYEQLTQMGFSPRRARVAADQFPSNCITAVEHCLVGASVVQPTQVPAAAKCVLECVGLAAGSCQTAPVEGGSRVGALEYLQARFSAEGVLQDRQLFSRRLHLNSV